MLTVPVSPQPREEQIEPVTDFLEGILNRVIGRFRMFVHSHGKSRHVFMVGVAKQVQTALDSIETRSPLHSFPRGFVSIRHHTAVQFDIVGVTQAEGRNEIVGFGDQVVNPELKHSDAGKDEVALVRVFY